MRRAYVAFHEVMGSDEVPVHFAVVVSNPLGFLERRGLRRTFHCRTFSPVADLDSGWSAGLYVPPAFPFPGGPFLVGSGAEEPTPASTFLSGPFATTPTYAAPNLAQLRCRPLPPSFSPVYSVYFTGGPCAEWFPSAHVGRGTNPASESGRPASGRLVPASSEVPELEKSVTPLRAFAGFALAFTE